MPITTMASRNAAARSQEFGSLYLSLIQPKKNIEFTYVLLGGKQEEVVHYAKHGDFFSRQFCCVDAE
jgi:hypothetical protein